MDARTAKQQPTSNAAIASLICGIFSLVPGLNLLAILPAFICGVVAKRTITRSDGTLSGRGLANAGMIMGVLGVLMWLGIGLAIVAVPALLKERALNRTLTCKENLNYVTMAVIAADMQHFTVTKTTDLVPQFLPKELRCPVNNASYIIDPGSSEPARCPNYNAKTHRATLNPAAHKGDQ